MPSRRGSFNDEQTEILRGMWSELKSLNHRIDGTNDRLDRTRVDLAAEISTLRSELKGEIGTLRAELRDEIASVRDYADETRKRVIESEMRLATAVTSLSHDVQELSGALRKSRVDPADLRTRLERLEDHTGIGRPK